VTKAERDYLAAVAALGCCVCPEPDTPAHVHHYKGLGGYFEGEDDGGEFISITLKGSCTGKKAPYWETFPLCPAHHTQGGYGTAIHDGIVAWEAEHVKRQWKLVKKTQGALGWEPPG